MWVGIFPLLGTAYIVIEKLQNHTITQGLNLNEALLVGSGLLFFAGVGMYNSAVSVKGSYKRDPSFIIRMKNENRDE